MGKILIFDFDGTIANTVMPGILILQNLSSKYGYKKLGDDEIEDLRNYSIREGFKMMHISMFKLFFIVKDLKQELHKQIETITVFRLKDVLMELKNEGNQLWIVTSNNKRNVYAILERNDLEVFDVIKTGSTVFGKSGVIKKLLKEGNIKTQDAIYIGDEIRDIDAAKKAGVPIIAVTWGANSRNGLERFQPNYIIDDPKELVGIIKSIP